jgi:hypothetical protein
MPRPLSERLGDALGTTWKWGTNALGFVKGVQAAKREDSDNRWQTQLTASKVFLVWQLWALMWLWGSVFILGNVAFGVIQRINQAQKPFVSSPGFPAPRRLGTQTIINNWPVYIGWSIVGTVIIFLALLAAGVKLRQAEHRPARRNPLSRIAYRVMPKSWLGLYLVIPFAFTPILYTLTTHTP